MTGTLPSMPVANRNLGMIPPVRCPRVVRILCLGPRTDRGVCPRNPRGWNGGLVLGPKPRADSASHRSGRADFAAPGRPDFRLEDRADTAGEFNPTHERTGSLLSRGSS